MLVLSPSAHGAFIVPLARLRKKSADAAVWASWKSSMRSGLGGPLAMDRFRVTRAIITLFGADASSAAKATVGIIVDEATAASEAAVPNNIPRRPIVSKRCCWCVVGVGTSGSPRGSVRCMAWTSCWWWLWVRCWSVNVMARDTWLRLKGGEKEADSGAATNRCTNLSSWHLIVVAFVLFYVLLTLIARSSEWRHDEWRGSNRGGWLWGFYPPTKRGE